MQAARRYHLQPDAQRIHRLAKRSDHYTGRVQLVLQKETAVSVVINLIDDVFTYRILHKSGNRTRR